MKRKLSSLIAAVFIGIGAFSCICQAAGMDIDKEDYMIVDGEKYLPTNEEGMNSVFEIPVLSMDEGMPVIADTTAMGAPHEIDYTLTFYSDSIGSKSQLPQEAAKRVVAVAVVIIVGGGILNYFVNKRNRC